MNARLRDRRLTRRPRIVAHRNGCFWVERNRVHGTDVHRAQAELAYSLTEAFDIATRWAGEVR